MTEITLKEIPVQILTLGGNDVLVMRCPQDWEHEQQYELEVMVNKALRIAGTMCATIVIGDHVSLAVIRDIVKAHQK